MPTERYGFGRFHADPFVTNFSLNQYVLKIAGTATHGDKPSGMTDGFQQGGSQQCFIVTVTVTESQRIFRCLNGFAPHNITHVSNIIANEFVNDFNFIQPVFLGEVSHQFGGGVADDKATARSDRHLNH